MISLHLMCIGFAALALSFGESEAGTHHYRIPASQLDSTQANQHIHKYTVPGSEHMHKYTIPNDHTYRYKVPGKTNTHNYRYKVPGMSNTHTYRYKEPGKTNTHHYRIPGQPGDGSPGQPQDPNQVTGVYSVINTIYNYFAVGGHLTGVPPLDLLLLKYYVAQGPKSFCPKGGN